MKKKKIISIISILLVILLLVFFTLINKKDEKVKDSNVNVNKEEVKDLPLVEEPPKIEEPKNPEPVKPAPVKPNMPETPKPPVQVKPEPVGQKPIEPKPIDPDTPVNNEPIIKTQEELNNEQRIAIERQYGITIKYGEEMGDYRLRGMLPNKLNDPELIKDNLNKIKTHIAYYPAGFFKEMKDFGMPLTLYLVKNIPGSDIAGIADKEFMDNIKITICVEEMFFRVFHHEVFHYIEAYMEIKGYHNGGIFKDWDSLNPADFIYGNFNTNYSYSILGNNPNPYFINDYGQTNDREDRATIFEDLMARAYEPQNSYVSPNNIWKKAKYISDEMDKYFVSIKSSSTERWERFIIN